MTQPAERTAIEPVSTETGARHRDDRSFGERLFGARAYEALRYCVLVFVIARIGFFLVGLVSVALLKANTPATVPGWKTPPLTHSWSVMFTAWERWDSLWYLKIATRGYASADGSAAFFPGYPLLVRDVSWITGGHPLLAGYLVSSIALVVGLTLVYLLTQYEFDRDLARRTVVLLCVFPTSLFFFAPYSESLFLACAVGAIFAARKSSWVAATWLAAAATSVRGIGVAVGFAIAVESLRQVVASRAKGAALARGLARTALVGLGSLVGIAAYLGWWWAHDGSPRIPFNAQGGWQRHPQWPWVTVWHGIHEGLRWVGIYSGGYQMVDLVIVAVALAAGIWAIIRLPAPYLAYTAASIIAPLCLTFPGRPFMSMPRFVLVILPLFWALAVFARRFHAWTAIVATSAAGLGMLSLLFVNWYYVF